MDWKRIPSLAALRAFEATARCGSYVAAARELNVTDAALRQHIRTLEAHFDTPLIARAGRGIALTEAGVELSAGLADGFARIQGTVDQVRNRRRTRPVRVALTPAFAENWLIPRLAPFWTEHPDIEIDLAPSIKPVDLGRGEHDLAIRYGTGDWPDCEAHMLAPADYTVVASPNLPGAAPVASLAALQDAVWLFEDGREEHRRWAQGHGLNYDAERNRFYPDNSLVLSAVRAGHGFSVQSQALVETDLKTGVLVAVFTERNARLGYYLLHPKRLRREAELFSKWISGRTV